jgi:hypothetical protein
VPPPVGGGAADRLTTWPGGGREKYIFAGFKEVKTERSLAECSKGSYGSKGAVLPMTMMSPDRD